MKSLLPLALTACAPKLLVATWVTSMTGTTEHVEVRSNGDVSYTASNGDAPGSAEHLSLAKEQVEEFHELVRTQRACELAHDPGYTPAADEGQTTLELAFPDLRCKIVLWNREWQQGRAREIAETMRSFRPLKRGAKPEQRQITPIW
ncbi:MAG TPA: hypothetical protein VF469_13905 [Kofleriaceae bacterium]